MTDSAHSPSTVANASVAPRALLFLLALVAGLSVANIYYIQPLLDPLHTAFPRDVHTVALLPAVTQLGYALGMFFVAPLGDRFARRPIILWLATGLAAVLIGMALAPSVAVFAFLCIPLGIFATIAQQAVPFAAEISSPTARGHAVGTVMSGLLLGILLARTAAGIIAQHAGWRAVYFAAALSIVVVWFLAWRLPHRRPVTVIRYPALLGSMWSLLRTEPELRNAALTGAGMFGAFSTFWSMLSLLLAQPPFLLGSQAAGLFGLAGAVGALIAPIVGKSADKRGPHRVISWAGGVAALSFVLFWLGGHSLIALAVGALTLDAGIQAVQISNQSRIYALRPEARSRLNTLYFVGSFLGGAAGSALAALAWTHAGWPGVCGVGLLFTLFALANHARSKKR